MSATYNLQIPQGTTYTKTFRWLADNVPVNLTGATARMQIRRRKISQTVDFEATTENGKLSINPIAGEIVLTIPAADTDLLLARKGVFDIEVVDSAGEVTRLLEGTVDVSAGVTR